MKIEDAENLLKRITYKEGFDICIDFIGPGEGALVISHKDVISTRTCNLFLAAMTYSDFVHKVYIELLDWERHECGEFFKYDNVAIFNPHTDVDLLKAALWRDQHSEIKEKE